VYLNVGNGKVEMKLGRNSRTKITAGLFTY
jgi:hypothetical protein